MAARVQLTPALRTMSNPAKTDLAWDKKNRCCNAFIETPKGGRNKFKYSEKHRVFELGGLLPEGLCFPFDFGFIPRTRGGDHRGWNGGVRGRVGVCRKG